MGGYTHPGGDEECALVGGVEYQTDYNYQAVLSETTAGLRMAFLRRVYGVLTLQLAWTSLLVLLGVFYTPFRSCLQHNGWWMVWLELAVSIGLLVALKFYQHRSPLNLILLSVWTTCMGLMVCSATVFVSTLILVEAALITLAMFAGLSFYALTTKQDFSAWGGALSSCLWGVIIAGFVLAFLPGAALAQLILAFLSGLLFCAYILYDTQNMLQRRTYDEWVDCVVELYLDILNLFLDILRILSSLQGDD